MQGDVKVTSKPGAGSTFTVNLVLRAAPANAPRTSAPQASPKARADTIDSQRPKVLVVDDHPINRDVLVRQLDLLGVVADAAADGAEALKAWARGGYAAVLTDIHMPEMDGYDLA